jgi:hypothetical protein
VRNGLDDTPGIRDGGYGLIVAGLLDDCLLTSSVDLLFSSGYIGHVARLSPPCADINVAKWLSLGVVT